MIPALFEEIILFQRNLPILTPFYYKHDDLWGFRNLTKLSFIPCLYFYRTLTVSSYAHSPWCMRLVSWRLSFNRRVKRSHDALFDHFLMFNHRKATLCLCGVITFRNSRLNIHATRSVEHFYCSSFEKSCDKIAQPDGLAFTGDSQQWPYKNLMSKYIHKTSLLKN